MYSGKFTGEQAWGGTEQLVSFGGNCSRAEAGGGVEGSGEREWVRADPGPGRQCTDFKEITWFAQCFTARNSNPGLLILDTEILWF